MKVKRKMKHFKVIVLFLIAVFSLYVLLCKACTLNAYASELETLEVSTNEPTNEQIISDSETNVETRTSIFRSESDSETVEEAPPLLRDGGESLNEEPSGSVDESSVVDAINNASASNNAYWELFLDSYIIEETQYLVPSYISSPYTWRFESNGSIGMHPQSNDKFAYVPVSVGYEYSVYNLSGLPSAGFRIGVVDSVTSPSVVSNFFIKSDLDSFTFYPSQNGYLVIMSNQHGVVANFQASYVLQRQESYTLSELGNAVMEIKSSLDSMVSYNDYSEYNSEDEFIDTSFYVSRYEYEILQTYKRLEVLLVCIIGLMFVMLFVGRRRKNGNT